MTLVWLLEFVMGILIFAAIITQVIIPLLDNTPVFPILRFRRKLEARLRDAQEDVETAVLERAIANKNSEADAMRSDVRSNSEV